MPLNLQEARILL